MANLSTKELTALEDQLSQESLLVKKYQTTAQSCTDPALKTKFDAVAAKHQDHFNRLYTYLQ